jgi:hypothetical protein
MVQLPLHLTFRDKLILFKLRTCNIKHYNISALRPELIHRPPEEQMTATTKYREVSAQRLRIYSINDKLAILIPLFSIIYLKLPSLIQYGVQRFWVHKHTVYATDLCL